MDHELECEEFLELIYGDREAWIDLPTKVSKHWVPFYTEWPNDQAVTRRIDSSLRDREDLYYSVAQFSQRGRRIEDVLPTRWLWADLDEIPPTSGANLGLLPSVAIESSPGRYQALWKLTREVSVATLEKLNRGLTYALDADKGGWDLTQVLRIPGTRNFKYPDSPLVRLLWINEESYEPQGIWRVVREIVPDTELRGVVSTRLPRRPIPRRAKQLLRAGVGEVVEGERSARLWELECLLAESGLEFGEIFDLLLNSAWNKWRGMGTGRARLEADIRKAMRHVGSKVREQQEQESSELPPREGRLPWVGYASFLAMTMEEPRWLVENIWTAGSHGLIAGEPKTNKTTIALALALSVASGAPFLGQHSVGVQGPVLMVQEENAPWMMQDRMRKLAWYYDLLGSSEVHVRGASGGSLGTESVDLDFPRDLPLKILNNYGFDLSLDDHRGMLEAEVEEVHPKLLILDPLYLILGGTDENKSASLQPFLKWLLQLRYKYDTAIVVIHHFRKHNANVGVVRPGQRIMGNAILHGWVDSALYLESRDETREGWVSTKIEREFRSFAPQKSMELSLSMSPPGGLEMSVELSSYSVEKIIKDLVRMEPGVTVNALAEHLKMDKRTVMARVRGAVGLELETGKKGRGFSHKVYLQGMNGNAEG